MMDGLSASIISFLSVPIVYLWISFRNKRQDSATPQVFGFFHPYCSGGGGGERVLWKMIQVLQSQGKSAVIYTIDPPDIDEARLRQDAERRFDVQISQPIQLISLEQYKDYLLPSPYLSLILESFGTMRLARKALKQFQPDVFCDTTGAAFTFLVARWMLPSTAKILAYVHYPTISTDMMLWEWQKDRVMWKTALKLVYYWTFAMAYGIVGSLSNVVMVNSTWTYNHIASLWRLSKEIHVVYPPCRVPNTTSSEDKQNQSRRNKIISIGQFRPEKVG
jgi:alpha-1,2-mannosyltransferase